mgnify:CR=1 FL=1
MLPPYEHQRHSYGGSKYLGEIACHHAVRDGLDVQIVRTFNAYGPRLNGDEYGQVIAMFFQQLIDSRELNVHGDGTQTRSFTWIDDVVDGFVQAGMQDVPSGGVYNIGSTEEISIINLAKRIAKFTDGVTISNGEGYHGDVKRRLPNTSSSEKLLGWKSTVSLDDGLELMWRSLNL